MLMHLKRTAKALRNAVRDPLPRSRILEFIGVEVERSVIVFRYRARGNPYAVRLTLPAEFADELAAVQGQAALEHSLTAIAVVFAARFFKLSDFAAVRLDAGSLDNESCRFFEDFFVGGLGQFRYLQGLDPRRRVSVMAKPGSPAPFALGQLREHALLLNGGGKDTIVAAEILLRSGQPFTWVSVAPNETRRRVIMRSGNPSAIEVGYRIEGELLKNQAYGWGHTPYASIVMAIGALLALLTRSRYVLSGNELSADSGNVVYRGHHVNHQYSKSSAYEAGFRNFVRRNIHPDMEVVSILRPFHDLQLAMLFSSLEEYFGDFVSCNNGIIAGYWCKRCPKCAFTALAIGAFAGFSGLEKIFGENILQRVEIRRWIRELTEGAVKPWECVGSREECVLALALLLAKEPGLDFEDEPRRADWMRTTAGTDIAHLRESLLERTSDRHLLPEDLRLPLNNVLRDWGTCALSVLPSSTRGVSEAVHADGPKRVSLPLT